MWVLLQITVLSAHDFLWKSFWLEVLPVWTLECPFMLAGFLLKPRKGLIPCGRMQQGRGWGCISQTHCHSNIDSSQSPGFLIPICIARTKYSYWCPLSFYCEQWNRRESWNIERWHPQETWTLQCWTDSHLFCEEGEVGGFLKCVLGGDSNWGWPHRL